MQRQGSIRQVMVLSRHIERDAVELLQLRDGVPPEKFTSHPANVRCAWHERFDHLERR